MPRINRWWLLPLAIFVIIATAVIGWHRGVDVSLGTAVVSMWVHALPVTVAIGKINTHLSTGGGSDD